MNKKGLIILGMLFVSILLLVGLTLYNDYNTEKKFNEILESLTDTKKIVIGDLYFENEEVFSYKETNYPILTTLEEQEKIKEVVDIFQKATIGKSSEVSAGVGGQRQNVWQFYLDNNEEVFLTSNTLFYKNRNYVFNLDREDIQKLSEIIQSYKLSLDEIKGKLKSTKALIIKDKENNKVIKKITNKKEVNYIMDILNELSGHENFNSYKTNHTHNIEFLDEKENLIGVLLLENDVPVIKIEGNVYLLSNFEGVYDKILKVIEKK